MYITHDIEIPRYALNFVRGSCTLLASPPLSVFKHRIVVIYSVKNEKLHNQKQTRNVECFTKDLISKSSNSGVTDLWNGVGHIDSHCIFTQCPMTTTQSFVPFLLPLKQNNVHLNGMRGDEIRKGRSRTLV